MSLEGDVLKLVCKKLDIADIPYMLTGSFAANFYAIPRMTRDVDIIIEINQNDIDKIIHTFQSEFYVDRLSIEEAVLRKGMFNIIHNESVFKVDFIICKGTPYRQLEFKRRWQVVFDNMPIWIVSCEDLIVSKLYWAKDNFSDMQLRDIRNLFQTTTQLDRNYILEWVEKLNLYNIYEKVNQNA